MLRGTCNVLGGFAFNVLGKIANVLGGLRLQRARWIAQRAGLTSKVRGAVATSADDSRQPTDDCTRTCLE